MRSLSSTHNSTVVLSTSVALVTASALLLWRRRRQSTTNDDEQRHQISDLKIISHKLLKLEELLYTRDEPAISTLTWFQGDYTSCNASSILRRRVQLIMEKNPWLTGRVVKRNNGGVFLEYYPKEGGSFSIDNYYFVVDPNESPFSRNTSVDHLGKAADKLLLKNGPTEPLFRVLVVPCRSTPQTNFALIVSLSHIVGDGATFYKISHMICSTEEDDDVIVPLVPDRISTSGQQQADAMGQQEYDFGTSLGLLINSLTGLLRVKTIGPRVKCRIVLLDNDKIQQAKEKAAKDENLPFVSTNDVLTSWFLQASGCSAGLMYVNFRNRLKGHTDKHAGNYDNAIFYSREDSKTPGLIRKSLLANNNHNLIKRQVTPNTMPSFWETLRGSYAIATNWTSFAQPNVIEGCQEELHIPLYDVDGKVPFSFCVGLIFRAGPGPPQQRLGLYMIGQEQVLERLQSAPFFSKDHYIR